MNKAGYVFAGWYTDSELTQYYEVSNPSESGELVLYAKWVEADKAAQLIVKGATLINDKVNPAGYAAVGETFREPVVTAQAGKKAAFGMQTKPARRCSTSPRRSIPRRPSQFTRNMKTTFRRRRILPVTTPEETTADTADTTTSNEEKSSGLSTGAIVAIVAVVVVIAVVVVLVVVKKKKK